MAKNPAVLFYTSDFLSGTYLLTMEERGQYITLLCLQHQGGHLSKESMLSICGSTESPVFKKFIEDKNKCFFNKRMDEECKKRNKFCESRSNNRMKKNKLQKKHMKNTCFTSVEHMENENENENINKNIKETRGEYEGGKAEEFTFFWDKYHKITKLPKTDKEPCFGYWKKLNAEEKTKAVLNIHEYYNFLSDKKYCKKARTYLRDKSFNDEFKKPNQPTNSYYQYFKD